MASNDEKKAEYEGVGAENRTNTTQTEPNVEKNEPSNETETSGPGSPDQQSSVQTEPQHEEKSHGPVTVPRSQRRGLFGRFAIIPEVENPYEYKNSTKWMMTIIVALAATTSSTGSSIFYPALAEVAKDLNTTTTIANMSLAFYMLSMAITPIWWSSFSEKLGRRSIYLLSFSLFLVFSIVSAVSVNIAMLIVMRILAGGAAASVQAIGAGTVADIWQPKERGRAMGIFYIGPLCGPGLAPIIGGALTQGFGWRSTLWFLAIFGGILFIMIFFCLPETLARREPATPEAHPQKINKGVMVLKRIVDPLKILAYLRYPPILVAVYSGSIAFGALFVINISIQASFSYPPYNFSVIEVGLLYLAPTLGYALASVLGGRWIDYIMKREARKAGRFDEDGKPKYLPEDRMKENIYIAATLYPAALIWFGWSVDKGLPWIVSSIAAFFFGIGSMLTFGAVTTMLTEFTPKRSSSGVAINNFIRNIISCTLAVVTQPLINAMGTGWMCTMIGLFAWVTGNAAILALKHWGPQWRVAMDKKLNPPKTDTPKPDAPKAEGLPAPKQ